MQTASMPPESNGVNLVVVHSVVEPNLIDTTPLGGMPFNPVTVTKNVSTLSNP